MTSVYNKLEKQRRNLVRIGDALFEGMSENLIQFFPVFLNLLKVLINANKSQIYRITRITLWGIVPRHIIYLYNL